MLWPRTACPIEELKRLHRRNHFKLCQSNTILGFPLSPFEPSKLVLNRASVINFMPKKGIATTRKQVRMASSLALTVTISLAVHEIGQPSLTRLWLRRITVLLRREGWRVNVRRVRRLYRLEACKCGSSHRARRVTAKLRDDRSNATGRFGNGREDQVRPCQDLVFVWNAPKPCAFPASSSIILGNLH